MFRTLFARRHREDARVVDFVRAMHLSERYTLDPAWELQPVPDDTQALPTSLVVLMVPVAR